MKLSEKILSAVRGDSVPKAEFDKVRGDLDAANQKIQELEASKPQASDVITSETAIEEATEALNQRIQELEGENAQLKDQIADLSEKIKVPSRQAASILAKAGAQTIPNVSAQTETVTMDFPALIKSQMAGGKTKAEALRFCVNNFPNEYAEWRKGDTSKL